MSTTLDAASPINRSLWTSSFVIFTAGMACVTLATCLWIMSLLHKRNILIKV